MATSAPAQPAETASTRFRRVFGDTIHAVVLVLSLLLIIYISYDTFENIPFLENYHYMLFQLWVCIIFLIAFFLELIVAKNKRAYLKDRWLFFLISIPYLNIINHWHITIPQDVLYYLRFVPLIRGAYSMTMVMGYISKNKAASLLSQYLAILATMMYLLAMLFFYQEHGVNPNVKTFWDALYWSAMNMTTVGCYIDAVTPVGKVISVILPIAGMLMLPMFTAYVTDIIRKYNSRPQMPGQ